MQLSKHGVEKVDFKVLQNLFGDDQTTRTYGVLWPEFTRIYWFCCPSVDYMMQSTIRFLILLLIGLFPCVHCEEIPSKLCKWQNADQKWAPYTGIRVFGEYEVDVSSRSGIRTALSNHADQMGVDDTPENRLSAKSMVTSRGFLIIYCAYDELSAYVQNVTTLLGKHCLEPVTKTDSKEISGTASLCVSISGPQQHHIPWQLEIIESSFNSNPTVRSGERIPLLSSKLTSRYPMVELGIGRYLSSRLNYFKTGDSQHVVLLHFPLLATPGVLNRKLPHAAP